MVSAVVDATILPVMSYIHVPAERIRRAAAGDHRVNAAAVIERRFQSVVEIAGLDDELHIAALRGNVRHEVVHPFVGGDAEKAQLFHSRALRVSVMTLK